MKIKKLDRTMGLFFAFSTVVLIYVFLQIESFFTGFFKTPKYSQYIRRCL